MGSPNIAQQYADHMRIVSMSDAELESYIGMCKSCMQLLEERLGIYVSYVVSKEMSDLSPSSRSAVAEIETVQAMAYRKRPGSMTSSRLYVFQNDRLAVAMKTAEKLKGTRGAANEVLNAGTDMMKLFGRKDRPAAVGRRVDLEYEAYVHAMLSDVLSDKRHTVACAGQMGNANYAPLGVCLLECGLPKFCDRPEYDLKLNVVMPEFKEVVL
jgi:hypothetical protein